MINNKYAALYKHRLITIGEEWYVDVEVTSIAPSFDRATLSAALHVKHGWPIQNIVISDALGAPLPGVPFYQQDTGQRLRALHLAGQRDPGKHWRQDLKVLIREAQGGLRADDPIEPDFK